MPPGKNLLDSRAAGFLPDLLSQLLDSVNRLTDLLLPALRLGNQPGDAPAMACDHDGRATLDLIEQLRQMSLGLRSLHFAQPLAGSIGSEGGGIFAEAQATILHCRF